MLHATLEELQRQNLELQRKQERAARRIEETLQTLAMRNEEVARLESQVGKRLLAQRSARISLLSSILLETLGQHRASSITPEDIEKLVDQQCHTLQAVQQACQEQRLQNMGVGNECIAAIKQHFQENSEVWVSAQHRPVTVCVEISGGSVDILQLAEDLDLQPRSMYIDGKLLTHSNFHQAVQQYRDRRGAYHWGASERHPIHIQGNSLSVRKLLLYKWLRQPITCLGVKPCAWEAPAPPFEGLTIDGLEPWEKFKPGVQGMLKRLMDCKEFEHEKYYRQLLEPSSVPLTSPYRVRQTMIHCALNHINKLADLLRIGVRYKECGSGRSSSFADILLLQNGVPEPNMPSKLVLGVCHTGVNLPHGKTLTEAFKHPGLRKAVTQQAYGDSALDGAPLLMLTEGEVILFLLRARDAAGKVLKVSPPVFLDGRGGVDALKPLACLLYFAQYAAELCPQDKKWPLSVMELARGSKQSHMTTKLVIPKQFKQSSINPRAVEAASQTGSSGRAAQKSDDGNAYCYVSSNNSPTKILSNPQQWLEAVDLGHVEAIRQLPILHLHEMHYTGRCLGGGKDTRVLQVQFDGKDAALKLYNSRDSDAVAYFIREVTAFLRLPRLQDTSIPNVLAVGRLYETGALALVMRLGMEIKSVTQEVKTEALKSLAQIHKAGVTHGNVSLANILSFGSCVWFTDLGQSDFNASKRKKSEDLEELQKWKCRKLCE